MKCGIFMKSRLVWMVATGLALAAIFLIFVQASSLLALAPDDTDVVSESDSEVQNDPKAEPVENSLQPVYVRTISEYGSGTTRKLRLGGTSQPNAVLTLLNQNERMRQLKVDENGLWQAELDFDSNASLVLEVIMFVEDGPSVRGDETIYRLPVPTSPDSDSGADEFGGNGIFPARQKISRNKIPTPARIHTGLADNGAPCKNPYPAFILCGP